jgi:hypothetical protein
MQIKPKPTQIKLGSIDEWYNYIIYSIISCI